MKMASSRTALICFVSFCLLNSALSHHLPFPHKHDDEDEFNELTFDDKSEEIPDEEEVFVIEEEDENEDGDDDVEDDIKVVKDNGMAEEDDEGAEEDEEGAEEDEEGAEEDDMHDAEEDEEDDMHDAEDDIKVVNDDEIAEEESKDEEISKDEMFFRDFGIKLPHEEFDEEAMDSEESGDSFGDSDQEEAEKPGFIKGMYRKFKQFWGSLGK